MNASPNEEADARLYLGLGQVRGALSLNPVYERLVASLSAPNGLHPAYIINLRDTLTRALRESGRESVPATEATGL